MAIPSEQAAQRFCDSPLWDDALWIATTYQWHPASEMPPIMGLVFANWMKGVEAFRLWVDAVGNVDEEDDLRVAILEGPMPGQTEGYTVRLSASLNEFLEDDDPDRMRIGRAVRMHPQLGAWSPSMWGGDEHVGDDCSGTSRPGAPEMLTRFKEEYARHGEFMLAPVTPHEDGRLYMAIEHGVIKRELVVRQVSEIGHGEPDMAALRACDDEGTTQRAVEHLRRIFDGFDPSA